jgi:2'-5' RNA ligase
MNPPDHKPERRLYFWAILPPEELSAEVDALRRECSRRFETKRALRLPVHLTIYPPFRIGKEDFSLMETMVRDWAWKHESFDVELDGFGFFNKKNPVAYVHVPLNPALRAFQSAFQQAMEAFLHAENDGRPFNPHMTIAQQDLDRRQLPAMKEFLGTQTIRATFEVRELCLFRHDGKAWSVEEKYGLGG